MNRMGKNSYLAGQVMDWLASAIGEARDSGKTQSLFMMNAKGRDVEVTIKPVRKRSARVSKPKLNFIDEYWDGKLK